MWSVELGAHLVELANERTAAEHAGPTAGLACMAGLESQISEYRVAPTGAVVTEIAVLRGESSDEASGE